MIKTNSHWTLPLVSLALVLLSASFAAGQACNKPGNTHVTSGEISRFSQQNLNQNIHRFNQPGANKHIHMKINRDERSGDTMFEGYDRMKKAVQEKSTDTEAKSDSDEESLVRGYDTSDWYAGTRGLASIQNSKAGLTSRTQSGNSTNMIGVKPDKKSRKDSDNDSSGQGKTRQQSREEINRNIEEIEEEIEEINAYQEYLLQKIRKLMDDGGAKPILRHQLARKFNQLEDVEKNLEKQIDDLNQKKTRAKRRKPNTGGSNGKTRKKERNSGQKKTQ